MAGIQFYLIDIDYITTQFGRAIIRLFGRTPENKKICCIERNFEPYFYVIPAGNADTNNLIQKIKECKEGDSFVSNVIIDDKKDISKPLISLKVFVNHPQDVPIISKLLEGHKDVKETRESDILFVRRYLIDKNLTPLGLCSASGTVTKEDLDVDLCINLDAIESTTESTNELRSLSFDIETYTTEKSYPNSKQNPIICIAFYSDDFKKVITWKEIPTSLDVTFVRNEQELILEFIRTIKHYKPDCLVGYFSDGFDFPYLIDRAKIYGIKLNLGLDNTSPKSNKRSFNNVRITGIPHIDLLKFIRTIIGDSLQVESYSLNAVASALLNEKKLEIDISKMGAIWDSNSHQINDILEYNLKDTELTHKLFKTVCFSICELVKLIGQPIDDVIRMHYGQLVEWYLIKKAKEFNELIPNKPRFDEKTERLAQTYQGAFVYQPQPGLYENLVVFDFKSLYPSIIIAHNIDPGTLTSSKENSYESPETIDESGMPKRYYFSYKEHGFIPTVIKDLIIRRNRIKEIIKKENKEDKILEARSYMLKIIANATYGMFGYSGARWYSKECAATVTAFGRDYILKSIEKAERENLTVIYSDTDSIAILLKDNTKQDALDFMKRINDSLPPFMELELEKFYLRGLFVMKKNELQGAKKKYVLIDYDHKLKIRGFETIRRDWSYLAKEVQLKVLEIILKERSIDNALSYVKAIIDDLRKKKIPLEKMIIKTQLRKDIKNYDSIGPHVEVAKKMVQNGVPISIGTIISYVVTEGKGIIRTRAKLPEECKQDEYDAEYYINNQIVPAVKTIFEAAGYAKDILTESKDQSKLDSFFGGEE